MPFIPSVTFRAIPTPPHTATRTADDSITTFEDSNPTFHRDVPALRDALLRTLFAGDAIAGEMRAAVATMIVRMPHWPEHRSLRLHTEADNSGRRYGPRAASPYFMESVHVMHRADGRFTTAPCAGSRPADWLDCGADSDSFFEAVINGLLDQDPAAYNRLLESLPPGNAAAVTAARRLREAVADSIEKDPEAAMEALVPLVRNRIRAGEPGKVDGQLVLELVAMGRDGISNRGCVANFARIYNVRKNVLRATVFSSGYPHERGIDLIGKLDPSHHPHAQPLRESTPQALPHDLVDLRTEDLLPLSIDPLLLPPRKRPRPAP